MCANLDKAPDVITITASRGPREVSAMLNTPLATDDTSHRGLRWYDLAIRSKVETDENIGKIIVIDADSGDYEIADEGLAAGRRLRERHPEADMLCLRIGYNAVYSLGGVLTRTKL